MSTVSIIIPAYNYGHYIAETIESCLKQTVPPLEIIVVDDGSADNTKEIVAKYPVKYIYQANRGLSGARNTGIAAATGDYILCLDSDDTIEEHFLEFTVDVDDIVAVFVTEFDGREEHYRFLDHPTYADFRKHNQIVASSLFRRKIWEKVGGYDEQMKLGYEDWDFWIRATKAGFSVTTVPIRLFNYRIHGDSMINNTLIHHEEIVEYINKKHDNNQ